jgi:hypothetical protein
MYLNELSTEFRNLGSWRKDSIPEWLRIAIPLVDDSQKLISDMANAALDIELADLLGEESVGSWADASKTTGAAVRNGVPPSEVYQRIFKPVWIGTGNGVDIDTAVEHGISRLAKTFNLDSERVVDLASIERFANQERIVGHERVLTGAHNCALCIIASTQVYHKRELKPIHPGCKCKTRPVMSFEQPKTLDRDLLDEVHSQIKDRFGISDRAGREVDYRKIMMVREHGEYGPTLTFRQYDFTGPGDLHPITPGE